MTAPEDPTREQPAVAPDVSTAPPPAQPHGWWAAIPGTWAGLDVDPRPRVPVPGRGGAVPSTSGPRTRARRRRQRTG